MSILETCIDYKILKDNLDELRKKNLYLRVQLKNIY